MKRMTCRHVDKKYFVYDNFGLQVKYRKSPLQLCRMCCERWFHGMVDHWNFIEEDDVMVDSNGWTHFDDCCKPSEPLDVGFIVFEDGEKGGLARFDGTHWRRPYSRELIHGRIAGWRNVEQPPPFIKTTPVGDSLPGVGVIARWWRKDGSSNTGSIDGYGCVSDSCCRFKLGEFSHWSKEEWKKASTPECRV